MEPEFFGSLFLFSLLSLLGNKKIRWVAYPIILLVIYFLQIHWLNAFVLGIALCDVYVNTGYFSIFGRIFGRVWIQISTGLIIMVLIGAPNYRDVFHLGIAVLVVAFCLSFTGYTALFSARVPVYLGKISFSLYLIHVPILCSATGLIYKSMEDFVNYPTSAVATSVMTIAICILAAHFFYEYADKQGIILGSKLANDVKKAAVTNIPNEPG